MADYVKMGKMLKELRTAEGLTQAQLAKEFLTTQDNISRLEKGKAFDCDIICSISKYFGVSADYLLGLSDVQSTDTTVKSVCEYIGCNEEVIDNLKSIYEKSIVSYEEDDEDDEKDIDFSLNTLNQILSAPYFAELIDEIFWLAQFSNAVYINPFSINFGIFDCNCKKKLYSALNLSNDFELSIITKKSLENNKEIREVEKSNMLHLYKTDTHKLSRQIDEENSQSDVSRYKANKILEKLMNTIDFREKFETIDTKEKWLAYLNLTEKEVEECKTKVQQAESLEDLFEIGALSSTDYNFKKNDYEHEQYFTELKSKNLQDMKELEKLRGEQSGKHTED